LSQRANGKRAYHGFVALQQQTLPNKGNYDQWAGYGRCDRAKAIVLDCLYA